MQSKITVKIEGSITITLTEIEARALWGITCYGADEFLKVFYKELGSSYLKPVEAGLKSLFAGAANLERELKLIDEARQAVTD